MAVDPVCGMAVREGPRALSESVRGTRFYFCSDSCRLEFTMPEKEFRRLKMHTGLAFAVGVMVLGLGFFPPIPITTLNWVFLALAAPIQFVAGARFYRGLWHAVKARLANMDTLIAVGTTAAFGYSTLTTAMPSRFGTATYFDTSALIIAFILLGRSIEHAMKDRAKDAVRKLLDLRPRTARVLVEGKEVDRPVEELQVGDVFVVRPGERIATDGEILEGRAAIDETMVTGESLPVTRGPGEQVIGATINTSGHLKVRAMRVGTDTTLAKIVELVERAQAGTAPIQRVADRVASAFVPIVILVALASFAILFLALGRAFDESMLAGVAVLIIACPCAIGLATPAALLVGTSLGASRGVLIKGGAELERAGRSDVVLFDKTGTLTRGEPSVVGIRAAVGVAESDVLMWAAAAEGGSEHPLGRAIVDEAKARGLAGPLTGDFEALAGEGVRLTTAQGVVRVGQAHWLRNEGIAIEEGVGQKDQDGEKTVVLVARDSMFLGSIALADTLKPGAKEAVSELVKRGLEVRLVSGDNAETANAIARSVGIEKVHARVLPDQKEALVRSIRAEGRKVAFVGDGINDAPALAAADVGIAIGSGTDVAVETGGIVLVRSDPRDVVMAIDLSRATMRKIRQNLFWAFAYNVVLIPVAATGRLDPMFAAAAMGLSSVSVVMNSLMLRRAKMPRWETAEAERRPARRRAPAESSPPEVLDPVCGMTVDPASARFRTSHEGKEYFFCSAGCLRRFEADPGRFLRSGPQGHPGLPMIR